MKKIISFFIILLFINSCVYAGRRESANIDAQTIQPTPVHNTNNYDNKSTNNYDNRTTNNSNIYKNTVNSFYKESSDLQYILLPLVSIALFYLIFNVAQSSDGYSPPGLFDQKE